MLENVTPITLDSAANSNDARDKSAPDQCSPVLSFSGKRISVLSTIQSRRVKVRQAGSVLYRRLSALGVTHDDYVDAVLRSRLSGASAVEELICRNLIVADEYYRRLAEDLDLVFTSSINPATILTEMNTSSVEHGSVRQLFGRCNSGLTLLYISPDYGAEAFIVELLEREPTQKSRIRICAPMTIVTALEANKSTASLNWATNDLYQRRPDLSAKQVFAPWQAYVLGLFCAALPVCLYQNFLGTALVIHAASSILFFLVILNRLAALRRLKRKAFVYADVAAPHHPTYSVLIALHKEAAIAGQLVRAMSRLDWPQSRLEVLYVCEADDTQTIEELSAQSLPLNHRIIKVPAGAPRTKPKALNFALRSCIGEFVVIYDAEDRPHPQQLKEAWSKFLKADESLACVQAPLLVSNAGSSWFARMFAFEYAAHFTGLLPYLAETGVPLPLGGTSNHFRKSALQAVGGWDPYNVTEDADLGIRFYRFGYRCDVLDLPTLEDGPETLREWFPQRTRWQKGWMQTFLVQNRNVMALFEMLGRRNAIHFEALLAGFILSPLLYFASTIMAAYAFYSLDPAHLTIAALDLILFSMGYICALALGLACVKTWALSDKIIVGLTLPFYWLLLSAAAWRAIYQLIIKPHHWEKTPHKPSVQDKVNASTDMNCTTAPPVLHRAR